MPDVDDSQVWEKPSLSGYLVCLVCLVNSVEPDYNQIDRRNQMNQTDRTDQMNKTGWRNFSASC
jgi:hypothetical protein